MKFVIIISLLVSFILADSETDFLNDYKVYRKLIETKTCPDQNYNDCLHIVKTALQNSCNNYVNELMWTSNKLSVKSKFKKELESRIYILTNYRNTYIDRLGEDNWRIKNIDLMVGRYRNLIGDPDLFGYAAGIVLTYGKIVKRHKKYRYPYCEKEKTIMSLYSSYRKIYGIDQLLKDRE